MLVTLFFIFVILCMLIASGYMAASETAITAASKAKLHHLMKEGDKRALNILNLRQSMSVILSTLLIGATILNTFIAILATSILGEIYASVVITLLLVIGAEILPKMLAVSRPETFLLSTASLLQAIYRIFAPLTRFLNTVVRFLLRLVGVNVLGDPEHATRDELRGVIDLHHGPGQDVPHERAMLKSILDLGRVSVEEIMVHRKNVMMLNVSDPVSHIVDQLLSSPFTRIPLWQGNADNIVGVVHTKALLRMARIYPGKLDKLNILEVAAKPWFIPESADLLEQLQAFRNRREHFALVVDEYGSFSGIVTLEDILEEIVGEITDEHDVMVKGVSPQEDGSYIIDGTVTIRDLNRQFEWNLPDEPASTVGGLVITETRTIPVVGQIFMLHDFRFEILRRQRNQITLLKISPSSSIT